MIAEKYILDATAGFRMMWYDKHDPNTLYIDQRPECEPDQIADFTHLPYSDESFRLIIFDPPHIVRSGNIEHNFYRTFGHLEPDNAKPVLQAGLKELYRLLKPYGVLLFKWCNYSIPSNEVIKLAPVKPLVYQVTANKVTKEKHRHSEENIKTIWFCFMKKPDVQYTSKEAQEEK
jgi:SAM-dependent methyltransferase